MRKLLLLSLVGLAMSANAAIDLTPTVSEYTAEGIRFRQLSFKDGKQRVIYEPPRQWTVRGGGSDLRLVPPTAERADASIQVTELPRPQPFDEKLFAALKEQCLRSVPPGAQNAVIVSEEQNPVRLERGDCYAVTVSYQSIGETFFRSVLFANIPDAQLTFRLTARKADFESLQRAFRSSILSWHWVELGPAASVAQK